MTDGKRSVGCRRRIYFVCAMACGPLFDVRAARCQLLEPPQRGIPLVDRDPQAAWSGQAVWQRLCGSFTADQVDKQVSVIEGSGDLVRDRYWILNEAAIGIVESVEIADSRGVAHIDVVFAGGIDDPKQMPVGWVEQNLEYKNRIETDTQSQTTVNESYGGGVTIDKTEHSESKERVGFPISGPFGRIVDRRPGSVVVRYNTDRALERRRPRLNDRVVRGPDWRGGAADGYVLDRWAQHPATVGGRASPFTGTVIDEGAGANDLLVKWDRTGRVTAHRFNVARFYDVQVVPDVRPPVDPQQPVNERAPAAP